MSPTLVDTDILSLFLRGDANVVAAFGQYLVEHPRINFSIITYYELLSGLRYRDARRQMDDFQELASESNVLPLTERACSIAADLYADLRQQGKPIDDIDLLISAIALSNNLVIATHNVRHFQHVPGLQIDDWTEPRSG